MKKEKNDFGISKKELKRFEKRGEEVMRGEEKRERRNLRRFDRDTNKGL